MNSDIHMTPKLKTRAEYISDQRIVEQNEQECEEGSRSADEADKEMHFIKESFDKSNQITDHQNQLESD